MLTREQLVCTKEQSLELIKLGCNQNTFFEWVEYRDQFGTLNLLEENTGVGIPAFTIGELAAIGKRSSGIYNPQLFANNLIKKLKKQLVTI